MLQVQVKISHLFPFTFRVTNVTAKRQRDSEANDFHLDGFKGDVKRHPGHVYFDPGVVKKVVLPEVDRANRDLSSGGTGTTPRIMEQELGPVRHCQSSPNDMIVKLVPTMSSAEQVGRKLLLIKNLVCTRA